MRASSISRSSGEHAPLGTAGGGAVESSAETADELGRGQGQDGAAAGLVARSPADGELEERWPGRGGGRGCRTAAFALRSPISPRRRGSRRATSEAGSYGWRFWRRTTSRRSSAVGGPAAAAGAIGTAVAGGMGRAAGAGACSRSYGFRVASAMKRPSPRGVAVGRHRWRFGGPDRGASGLPRATPRPLLGCSALQFAWTGNRTIGGS